jgi:orotate phosphoribosyltransferase
MTDKTDNIVLKLIDIEAIKLQPKNPFTWASGWNSPIYCDNRKTLSHPVVREIIKKEFARQIKELYPDVEGIAGVATGAIAHGVLVADELNLPFIYVRPDAKKHGLGNQIEGAFIQGQKFVVIEDLISTGGSSLAAVRSMKEANVEVMGMLAIFTYGFPLSEENFAKENVRLDVLSNYSSLLELAVQGNYINEEQLISLKEWRQSPQTWRR